MSQPESRLSRDIRRELEARDAFVFKIHGGPTMMAGLPDLIGCYRGAFFGIESKMPGNEPTEVQLLRHAQIRESHGLVYVCQSMPEALNLLDEIDDVMDDVVKLIHRPTLWKGPQGKRRGMYSGRGNR